MPTPVPVTWVARDAPLTPAAAVATGVAAARLRDATLGRLSDGQVRLGAAAGDGWLLVLGDEAELPWADGVTYLGWDAGALLPTTLRPSIPTELLRSQLSASTAVVIVILPGTVLNTDVPVRTADPERLRAWSA